MDNHKEEKIPRSKAARKNNQISGKIVNFETNFEEFKCKDAKIFRPIVWKPLKCSQMIKK